jgi:hypothetical protein
MQVVATLGLENNLVDHTWSGAHSIKKSTGNSSTNAGLPNREVDSETWIDEAWIAGSAFGTTIKLGRQALDTPLAFTETWGVDKNTFEAAVLINQSLAGTTLVAAYVGKYDGSADEESDTLGNEKGSSYIGTAGAGSYVAGGGKFSTFGSNGAYALGAVNNSWKPLTTQAWYYSMTKLAKAYWVQTDLDLNGALVGVQYANVSLNSATKLNNYLGTNKASKVYDTSVTSAMLGYKVKDVVTVKAAYSKVDTYKTDGFALGVANTATGHAATLDGQSKLYTEMWWNYGVVSYQGAESMSLTAEAKAATVDFLVGFYSSENKQNKDNKKVTTEITLTASKSFGPLDTSLALISTDKSSDVDANKAENYTSTDIQAYLTYNF